MSRAIFDAPVTVPAPSMIGETVIETSTSLPSLRRRDGFEVLHPPAGADLAEHVVLLGAPFRRDDERDRPPDRLGGRIAEQTLGAAVPRRDDAVQILADDRVVARLDDRGELPLVRFGEADGVAQARDQRADRAEQDQRQQIGGLAHRKIVQRLEIPEDRRRRRQGRDEQAGPEAAVARRHHDRREEQEVRHRAAEPGIDAEPQEHRDGKGQKRERVGAQRGHRSDGHVTILVHPEIDDGEQRKMIGAEPARPRRHERGPRTKM